MLAVPPEYRPRLRPLPQKPMCRCCRPSAAVLLLGAAVWAATLTTLAIPTPAPAQTPTPTSTATPAWRSLGPGVDYSTLLLSPRPSLGDGLFHLVRIDPRKARLVALATSAGDKRLRTARQWRDEQGLLATINAGMYATDFSTHSGFFRVGGHTNSPAWVDAYRSILLIGPKGAAAIHDASTADRPEHFGAHDAVAQNLRLIRAPGVNVWKENGKRWSEAALGIDAAGNILFIFSRSPLSMVDFNDRLLALPLGIRAAMHLEGGPEASLSVGGGINVDLAGSYETGFTEHDDNREQWPLPNVLGVAAP